jgi:hypothetical protein
MINLLTPAEARKEYHLGRDFVRTLIRDRKIPTVMLSPHKCLLPRDGIEAYLRQKTIPAKRRFFGSYRKSPTTNGRGEEL